MLGADSLSVTAVVVVAPSGHDAVVAFGLVELIKVVESECKQAVGCRWNSPWAKLGCRNINCDGVGCW